MEAFCRRPDCTPELASDDHDTAGDAALARQEFWHLFHCPRLDAAVEAAQVKRNSGGNRVSVTRGAIETDDVTDRLTLLCVMAVVALPTSTYAP